MSEHHVHIPLMEAIDVCREWERAIKQIINSSYDGAIRSNLVHVLERLQMPDQPLCLLTQREAQVFKLFINGSMVKNIARELRIDVRTTSVHKRRAMAKLGLKSDFEVYMFGVKHKMIKEL